MESGLFVQRFRTSPSQGGDHGFKSRTGRRIFLSFPGEGHGIMLKIILCGLIFFVPEMVSAGKLDIFTIHDPAYTAPGRACHTPELKTLWTPGSGIYFRGEPWEIQVAGRSANTALAILGLTQSNSIADSNACVLIIRCAMSNWIARLLGLRMCACSNDFFAATKFFWSEKILAC